MCVCVYLVHDNGPNSFHCMFILSNNLQINQQLLNYTITVR